MESAAALASAPDDATLSQRRDHALAFVLNRINYEQATVLPYGERTLGLDRMRSLVDGLGTPDRTLRIIHIAGTKGKGSTATMIASILTAAGLRTGLFTSPHISQLEERLSIDGTACSGEQLVALVDRVHPVVEAMDREADATGRDDLRPTYFEIVTALAMLHFAEQQVDAAVLEVGLGGRLDSTNISHPLLTLITSISFDHTKQLGNTLASIAAEKAGILKPGVPVVSGVTQVEPRDVIRAVAREKDCPLVEAGREFDWRQSPRDPASGPGSRIVYQPLADADTTRIEAETSLLGRHQAANAALAIAAVTELRRVGWSIPHNAITAGLAAATLPARIEVVQRDPLVIIDTAHNVASVRALVEVLDTDFAATRRTAVLAVTCDKDVPGMLRLLVPRFERIISTRYVSNPRAIDVATLNRHVRDAADGCEGPAPQLLTASSPAQVWELLQSDVDRQELVVVTGSFFIAAELRTMALSRPLPG